VKRELENGTSFGLPTKKEVELAELVKNCFPSIEKLRLTTSGTEAAMASVRVARAFTGKNKIIKFEGCYHGHSDSLLVKAGSGLLTFEHQDSNGITKSVTQDTITAPFGDIEKIKEILANEKDVACVIVEPIPANMGLIETEKEFLQQLRELTAKENVVLIFDEVITGFRVTLGGAQKLYGITPDLTILGKIIGGGYPVGGFGGKEEIMNLISPVGNVYHAGTLSGNPVSVAAGIKTISILKENPKIYEALEKRTKEIVEKVGVSQDDENYIKKLREHLMKYVNELVYRSCEIKKEVVEKDEKESNLRMILNFGHTIGHAIEQFTNYEKYSHGEAISAGMVDITKIGEKKGLTKKDEFLKIEKLLKALNFPSKSL